MVNIRTFDLNLLLALKALVEDKSVSRAAEKLCLSQPAMSHVLRRLRSQLDDPILVKTSAGMIPTERALALLGPTVDVLKEIERIVQPPPDFDAATSRRRFVIAASDYVMSALLPSVAEKVARAAPNVVLDVRSPVSGPPHVAIEEESIDLAIGFDGIFGDPPHVRIDTLKEEHLVCLTRKDNAKAPGDRISLKQYLECKHMRIAWRESGMGLVDDGLTKLGLQRDIAVVLPHFMTAPWILERTDLLLCLPVNLAEQFVQLAPLKILPIPFDLPRYELIMLWHPRQEKDPGHAWLRNLILETCAPTEHTALRSKPARSSARPLSDSPSHPRTESPGSAPRRNSARRPKTP